MNPILTKEISPVIDWLNQIDNDEQLENLIDEMGGEQPLMLAFLMEMGEDDFNDDEQELLLFLGVAVWRIMREANNGELAAVSEAVFELSKNDNLAFIEEVESGIKQDFLTSLAGQPEEYPQADLLAFVIESVTEEEAYWVRPKNQSMMVAFLKIVIDCFDAVS